MIENKIKDGSTTDDHITLKTKFSYGLGALGKDFACAPIYIFLMFYFTDVAGIPAAFVGTIFLAARIIDAVTDPMMGMIVDNTRSRFGKFRPWILIGTLINSVFLVALFCTHLFEGTTLYIYATVIYILWGVTYTIVDIPYWSMIPAISKSRPEREKLVIWPRLFASAAWFVTGTYGLWIVAKLGDGSQGHGFFMASVIIVVIFILGTLITVKNVKETVKTEANIDKFSAKDVINIIKNNDQLKSLIATVLSFQIANMLVGGFAIYYFSYALGDPDLFPIYMMVAGIAEIAGVFIFPHIAHMLPRRYLWIIACSLPILSCALLAIMDVVSPGNAIIIGAAGMAIKLGVGIFNALSTVMLADVVDYGEYRTGRRSESVIFSVQTMLVKLSSALGAFIIGMGLTIVGYQANEIQTVDTIFGIKVMMIGIPATFMILSALIYKRFYKLHEGFSVDLFEEGDNETAKFK